MEITGHSVETAGHETFYLASGPEDGPLVVFCHGWPELSLSWRHQLPCLGALGFRAVAPDMRGYGRSTIYNRHEDYRLELIVGDMIRLQDALGVDRAVWVGHDWGAPVVWSVASHHPERCHGVAGLCVPYRAPMGPTEAAKAALDRTVYPEDQFPYGQWEYQKFYEEDFARAIAPFDADPYLALKALFRKGNPKGRGKPAATAYVRRDGGWFRGAATAPDLLRDGDVVSEEDLRAYSDALARNGMFGPASWYMNHAANGRYASRAANGGVLEMPVLFLAARYDYTCECVDSTLAEPMRGLCRNLTERIIPSGHWMAQERPREVNAALVRWLATVLAAIWPEPRT